ncbi:MAG: winged helix-turn-helix domain-containing protein [Colwellia sp.]|nr:winged helix-turn-helix domain-containing protein [Colwellia sp.]
METNDLFYIGQWRIEPKLNRISAQQHEIILVPKVMSLLLLLVKHAGEPVSQQKILEHVWSEQVVSDSSIYQAIAQLRKAFGDSARQKHFIERVSGKGYRLIAQVSEQSSNVITDPVSRLEIKTDTDTVTSSISSPIIESSTASITKKTRALASIGIVSLVFLFIGYFLDFSKQSTDQPSSTTVTKQHINDHLAIDEINSIGLVNLTIDQDNMPANLVALNDVLLTQLMHFKGIQVINLKSAVHAADAQAVLSGNISQQDAEIRIYLKLEQTENQQIIWAKQFTGSTDNIFALQDTIVASLLQLFNRQQAVGTFNKQNIDNFSFDQYLLARHLWDQRDIKSLKRSQQLFESLQKNGRLFPLAAVGLCDTYHYLHIYSDWSLMKALDKCEPLLEQALAEQPNLGQAIAAKALLLSQQGKKQAAEKLFQQAITLAPNYAFTYMWYSSLLRDLGQYPQSLKLSQKAYQLAPMSPIINRNLAYSMLNLRKMSQAKYYYQRALELAPDYSDRAVGELDFFDLNSARAKAFIVWLETNQSKLIKQPNFALTKAQIDLALGDIDSVLDTIKVADKISVNPSFLLFIKLAVATAQAEHHRALELLDEREKLHNTFEVFSTSRVIVLSQMGKYQAALGTLLKYNPELAKVYTVVTEQNMERFLLYYLLQVQLPLQAKLTTNQLSQLALLFNELSTASIAQAEWYLLQGNIEQAQDTILAMFNDGWLPDYNNDMYPEARMKKLFINTELGEQKYQLLLKINRELVI